MLYYRVDQHKVECITDVLLHLFFKRSGEEKMSEADKNLFVTIVLWTTIWANKDKSSFTRFFPSKGKEAENEGKVAVVVESEERSFLMWFMKEQAPALLLSFFRQMLMTWHKISGFDSQNPRKCHLLFVENNESLFTHLDKASQKLITTLLRGKSWSRWRTKEFLWSSI